MGMRNGVSKIAEKRDDSTFRSLFLTFGPKLRAMLMRQGADRATAEDIVQDTMLTVWSKSHLFTRDRGALSTWIFTIARNLRTDRIRRQIVWEKYCGDLGELHAEEKLADEQVSHEQERLYLTQAIAALPAEQGQIIELSYIHGLSQSEIAERLHVPLGTVKSRMRLAFEKLRCSVESE
jgi:RNA polymerase sigma-70 factor (ECF subfamily)